MWSRQEIFNLSGGSGLSGWSGFFGVGQLDNGRCMGWLGGALPLVGYCIQHLDRQTYLINSEIATHSMDG